MRVKFIAIHIGLLKRAWSKLCCLCAKTLMRFSPEYHYKKNGANRIKKIGNDNVPKMKLNAIPKIVIEASNTCNLNCSMCRTLESKRPKGEMSLELFKYILKIKKKFKQNGFVMHTVGEPFMYSYFKDVLKLCSENNMYLWITTNGILLDKQMPAIKKYPSAIRHMAFSIDGATEGTYESIRKGANFEKLLENLDIIKDYHHKSKARFSLSLQACLSKENFNQIPLFYKIFMKYFGIENMRFGFLSSLSAEHENNPYYEDTKIDLQALYKRNYPCKLLWCQTHVLRDGRISACCRDYNGELVVGDIKKESILDIWNGNPYNRLREKHLKGEIDDLPLCRDCYRMDNNATLAFNSFLKHLFTKFTKCKDEFYMNRINEFLKYIVGVKEGKRFIV